jgi:hypothetical protein
MKLPKDQKVYVIGMSGIEDELRDEGVSFVGGTVRELPALSPQPNRLFPPRIQPIARSNLSLLQILPWIPKSGPCYADSI